MTSRRKRFGAFIRRKREAKGLGLREMAKLIAVSPTYLSKIERDEFPPPAEDKVTKIAEIIGCDSDELLALAGKVSSDITQIIREHPREMTALVRGTLGMSEEELRESIQEMVEKMKGREIPKLN